MTSPTLSQLARKVYGPQWPPLLAKDFDVHRTTVLRWCHGTVPIPKAVMLALTCMANAKKASCK